MRKRWIERWKRRERAIERQSDREREQAKKRERETEGKLSLFPVSIAPRRPVIRQLPRL